MASGPVTVTGASGNVGEAVVDELAADSGVDVIAVVRDPARLRVEGATSVRVADYSDQAAMRAALETLVFVSSGGAPRDGAPPAYQRPEVFGGSGRPLW